MSDPGKAFEGLFDPEQMGLPMAWSLPALGHYHFTLTSEDCAAA